MNPSDIDLGPLTWVHGEIDWRWPAPSSRHPGTPADASTLRFAQTHLHQARGALSIVGLDGLTHFCETIEQVLEKAAEAPERAPLELLVRTISATPQFLEDLLAGGPTTPSSCNRCTRNCRRLAAWNRCCRRTCSTPTCRCARRAWRRRRSPCRRWTSRAPCGANGPASSRACCRGCAIPTRAAAWTRCTRRWPPSKVPSRCPLRAPSGGSPAASSMA